MRFWIALLFYKLVLLGQRLTGRSERMYPGLIKQCFKICPDYLKRLKKPDTVIFVTGTNGKTSTCGILRSILEQQGYKVLENTEWSMKMGFAHWLAKDVTLFNRSRSDVAVFELDELKSLELLPLIPPDYILVTNLCRDSLKRNGYPAYIFDTLDQAVSLFPNAKIILNADDPISGLLRKDNGNNLYVSILGTKNDPPHYNAFDMAVCPHCLHPVNYVYRHYMHIGKAVCPNCGLTTPAADLTGLAFDGTSSTMDVQTKDGVFAMPLLSHSIFNAYNVLLVAGLLTSMGYTNEQIISMLKTAVFPKSREDYLEKGDYRIYNQMAKGQNVSATTAVFEYLGTLTDEIEIVMLLDEKEGMYDAIETITWLYDTDFEFLNTPYIKKIIVGSKIYEDYVPRLLLAGIPRDKFLCCTEEEVPQYIDLSYHTIYMLYDSDAQEKVLEYRDALEKEIDTRQQQSDPIEMQDVPAQKQDVPAEKQGGSNHES